jgi:hypothetical protein
MKTIAIEVAVNEVRKVGNGVQVWVQVGDYNACLWMTEEEARANGVAGGHGQDRK